MADLHALHARGERGPRRKEAAFWFELGKFADPQVLGRAPAASRWRRVPSRSAWRPACSIIKMSPDGSREVAGPPGRRTIDGKRPTAKVSRWSQPAWSGDDGEPDPNLRYEFLCVDGGVMNNEPLDLARRVLAGPLRPEPSRRRQGRQGRPSWSCHSPTPNPSTTAYDPDESILLGPLLDLQRAHRPGPVQALARWSWLDVLGRLQPIPDRAATRVPRNGKLRALHHRVRLAGRLRRLPLAEIPRARLPARPAQLPVVPRANFDAPPPRARSGTSCSTTGRPRRKRSTRSVRRAGPIPRTRLRSRNARCWPSCRSSPWSDRPPPTSPRSPGRPSPRPSSPVLSAQDPEPAEGRGLGAIPAVFQWVPDAQGVRGCLVDEARRPLQADLRDDPQGPDQVAGLMK